MRPSASGAASTARRSISASSKPGRCHGTQMMRRPYRRLNSSIFLIAVRAGGQGDRPVGMEVIDVVERQERMQRGVDRRGDAVVAERAQRVVPDHLVLVRLATIAIDELLELVEVQQRESRRAHRPEIAAAALDGEHARRLARHRIGQVELRAGVAAAEIGDPQVRAEQVGAVPKQFQRAIARAPPRSFSSHKSCSNDRRRRDRSLDTHDLPILLKPAVVRGPAIARDRIESLDRK